MSDTSRNRHSLDLEALRAELRRRSSPTYWRSLEEVADTPELHELLAAEFPAAVPELQDPVARRDFLKLMGASLALAGVSACVKQPTEKIVPYVDSPESVVPGKPLHFATALVHEGWAHGVLVESHEGRPTKIEGNPGHPASRGATNAQTQAAILTLYDPDRSQSATKAGWPSSWSAFLAALAPELEVKRLRRGAGLRLLTGAVTSPSLCAQAARLQKLFPEMRWYQWEPLTRDGARLGARMAFGRDVQTHYRLELADVIVALDADLFIDGPGAVRSAYDFAARRRAGAAGTPNRLYVVEGTPSATGSIADHRLSLKPSRIVAAAEALAALVVGDAAKPFLRGAVGLEPKVQRWLEIAAEDLLERRHGTTLIVVGDSQPAEVHALVHLMNGALGNAARTVIHTEPVETRSGDDAASIRDLVTEMQAGAVDLLVMIETNPVYTAPVDLDFAKALEEVAVRVRLGLYDDETSALCHWHVPAAHSLESWGDARAFDGSVTIQQPLIAPLYGGRSAHELLAALLGESPKSDHTVVQEHWQNRLGSDFAKRWEQALNDGVIRDSAEPPLDLRTLPTPGQPLAPLSPATGLELSFRPDPSVRDGTTANNGWLQELSKPLTKLTWDNAALVSPKMAERLALQSGDLVTLTLRGRSVEAPISILPGQADEVVTLHLGYGRKRAGRVGNNIGVDAYKLRASDALWTGAGVALVPTGRHHLLASTQDHHSMEGRALVRSGTLGDFAKDPSFAQRWGHNPPPGLSLYPDHLYEGSSWGMVVDLSTCIGCNACVIACHAENNIAVVGKTQVAKGREMAWLRVDRYFEGSLDNPKIVHQPVMCQHCEQAPCEPVCPVGATVHSSEGLNEMIYNRCVGTRYCSNNCPYKVRRFNFLHYTDTTTESFKAQRNPNVTVRSRGVMEKCTYCVQRISLARVGAKKTGRPIKDGDIQTACEAACPTRAITFGNLNDAAARVTRLKAGPLNYSLLGEIGTRPRTTYLARLSNPNPELEEI
jgi:MoCo/4Fe-4S cofactor protein with predicted Tat translocation signal